MGYPAVMSAPRKIHGDQSPTDTPSAWASLGVAGSPDHSGASIRIASDLLALFRFWPVLVLLKLLGFCFLYSLSDDGITFLNTTAIVLAAVSAMIDLAVYGFYHFATRRKIESYMLLRFAFIVASLSSWTYAAALISCSAQSQSPLSMAFSLVAHCLTTMIVMLVAGKQRMVALAFSSGLVMILSISLPLSIFLVTAAVYATATVFSTMVHVRKEHTDYLTRENEIQDEQRARLLLDAFEKASLGWFWETDRNGRIVYISDSILASAANHFDSLIGMPFADLIMPHIKDAGTPSGERTLGFHLSSRSSFKEIAVRSTIFSEERWWSLSGKPIMNDYGQFQGFRGSGADLTEMRRSQAEVKQLAQFDSLTGLSNRLQMLGILEKAIVGAAGETRPCALIMLDLDRFKAVNDTLGHPAGDALLKQVSQRLERSIGEDGHAGRIGGDEFKVILPNIIDQKTLATIADEVISTLSQPYTIDGVQVVIGASLGIAVAPEHGSTTESLIRNADLALYAAKDSGRGVHRFYDKSMHADAEERRNLEQDLRQALALNQLYLVYQPQVSTTTEQISGFEALLRWNHPKLGNISPAVFIPVAEDAGLIQQIGEWVLRTACFQVAKWPDDVKVAVNVSSIQFANPAFPAIVASALSNSQILPDRLELEITESVFLNEGENTNKMFTSLKTLGVRLSLDDFGTGYSSLGYLKNAPFDKIKIDQGFVRGATIPGNRNAAIITSIVSLAEALDMETIAEGAETHDELDLIRSLGCSHVQGYIYSKPLLPKDVSPLLENRVNTLVASGFRSSRPQRQKMLRSVTVVHDNHKYDAKIKNISTKGALVVGLWNVPPDTEFMIELSQYYRCTAKSRWAVDDQMGVQFDQEIDFDRLNPKSPAMIRPAIKNIMSA